MISYKDKTWCSRFSSGDCKHNKCSYALNNDERYKGTQWWGSANFPVMFGDRKTEDCGYDNGTN